MRQLTNRERIEYVRANLGLFAGVTCGWLVGGGLILLLFWALGIHWLVPVAVGALIVGYLWFCTAALNAVDGTWLRRQGAGAEELTSGVLRRLRRDGWRTIDSVEFTSLEVDHVLVGPGGVWAIETKNSMVPMKVRPDGIDLYGGDPCVQARQAARKIELLLRSGDGPTLEVSPAVVLWGPGAPKLDGGVIEMSSPAGPVLIFEGQRLRSNLRRFDVAALSPADVASACDTLSAFVVRRDAYERTRR